MSSDPRTVSPSGRFVILLHEMPATADRETHFDLMLEAAESLLTWALPSIPQQVPLACQQLPPHRLAYLSYEGPVSADRGTVTRWDDGTFQVQRRTDELIAVRLDGRQLVGELTLRQEDGTRWTVSFSHL